MKKYSTVEFAQFIINRCNLFNIEINNQKLQKLLFVIQSHYINQTCTLAFNDEFEAWSMGPVLRKVYETYSLYGDKPLPTVKTRKLLRNGSVKDVEFDFDVDDTVIDVVDEVLKGMGRGISVDACFDSLQYDKNYKQYLGNIPNTKLFQMYL